MAPILTSGIVLCGFFPEVSSGFLPLSFYLLQLFIKKNGTLRSNLKNINFCL